MALRLGGCNLVAGTESAEGTVRFRAEDPSSGAVMGPEFVEATPAEVGRAVCEATRAAADPGFRRPEVRAALLRSIAEELEFGSAELVERAMAETGLPRPRLEGELGRAAGQARLFAGVVEEGSWVEARIDHGDPDRTPTPKPDLRRMLIPVGPVAVFGASNFPFAFSVPGGDTVSALAAGCPVVVKAHPAHPGTSELAARSILRAMERRGLSYGLFSLIQGAGHSVGLGLVTHPGIRAVGFTGSLQGGRALFDAAAARPEPIPVYAEMGSVNPVFLLPGALRDRAEGIAQGLFQSFTLGVGQFCTKPGLVFAVDGPDLDRLLSLLEGQVTAAAPATMLHAGICRSFHRGSERLRGLEGVRAVSGRALPAGTTQATPWFAETVLDNYLSHPGLADEVFGPVTVVVRCRGIDDLVAAAGTLSGQLTATIHAVSDDLGAAGRLVEVLGGRAGRLVWNGFPTGVEVGHAIHHGGPYPATTDVRSTSVGTAAIQRFARPVCYQNFPEALLPIELRDRKDRGIWRLVDGKFTD